MVFSPQPEAGALPSLGPHGCSLFDPPAMMVSDPPGPVVSPDVAAPKALETVTKSCASVPSLQGYVTTEKRNQPAISDSRFLVLRESHRSDVA
ncbi:hypothetical protein CB1_000841007 [Camelus ferus]|nr:hypothetical protein CB1_000841007 [Camelus ferus]